MGLKKKSKSRKSDTLSLLKTKDKKIVKCKPPNERIVKFKLED